MASCAWNWKIELVAIPVTDVDRAKAFYVDQVGFNADHDYQVNEDLRFVQLTPPGSACSIVMGTGITDMQPGSQRGVQVVVADVAAARDSLIAHGVPWPGITRPGAECEWLTTRGCAAGSYSGRQALTQRENLGNCRIKGSLGELAVLVAGLEPVDAKHAFLLGLQCGEDQLHPGLCCH
jgi:catechol 2,3-dioxygenase-like lactoylglutathione lyase family enzyme